MRSQLKVVISLQYKIFTPPLILQIIWAIMQVSKSEMYRIWRGGGFAACEIVKCAATEHWKASCAGFRKFSGCSTSARRGAANAVQANQHASPLAAFTHQCFSVRLPQFRHLTSKTRLFSIYSKRKKCLDKHQYCCCSNKTRTFHSTIIVWSLVSVLVE